MTNSYLESNHAQATATLRSMLPVPVFELEIRCSVSPYGLVIEAERRLKERRSLELSEV